MSTEERIAEARARLAPFTDAVEEAAPDRLNAPLPVEQLLPAAAALIEGQWSYLTTITGTDLGPEAGEFEVLYHFSSGALVTTVRVRIPRDEPAVPSVCGLIPAASFYERELMEMFGIVVEGTPNPDRLFLPDDWPVGVYPLRKDFDPSEATVVIEKDPAND
jgi:NADH:ubiquinone oxidoreductase subunit C